MEGEGEYEEEAQSGLLAMLLAQQYHTTRSMILLVVSYFQQYHYQQYDTTSSITLQVWWLHQKDCESYSYSSLTSTKKLVLLFGNIKFKIQPPRVQYLIWPCTNCPPSLYVRGCFRPPAAARTWSGIDHSGCFGLGEKSLYCCRECFKPVGASPPVDMPASK